MARRDIPSPFEHRLSITALEHRSKGQRASIIAADARCRTFRHHMRLHSQGTLRAPPGARQGFARSAQLSPYRGTGLTALRAFLTAAARCPAPSHGGNPRSPNRGANSPPVMHRCELCIDSSSKRLPP